MPTRSSGEAASPTLVTWRCGWLQAGTHDSGSPNNRPKTASRAVRRYIEEPATLVRDAETDKHLLLDVAQRRDIALVGDQRVGDAEVGPVAHEVVERRP